MVVNDQLKTFLIVLPFPSSESVFRNQAKSQTFSVDFREPDRTG
jgi:hypothetical protein